MITQVELKKGNEIANIQELCRWIVLKIITTNLLYDFYACALYMEKKQDLKYHNMY